MISSKKGKTDACGCEKEGEKLSMPRGPPYPSIKGSITKKKKTQKNKKNPPKKKGGGGRKVVFYFLGGTQKVILAGGRGGKAAFKRRGTSTRGSLSTYNEDCLFTGKDRPKEGKTGGALEITKH